MAVELTLVLHFNERDVPDEDFFRQQMEVDWNCTVVAIEEQEV